MAMIVSGVTISATNVPKLLKNARLYFICFVKLIIIPAVLALVMSLFSVDEEVRMTVIVAAASPPAAMCTLFCIKYNKNSVYASEIFTAGTILSVLTLPVIVKFTEILTNLLH